MNAFLSGRNVRKVLFMFKKLELHVQLVFHMDDLFRCFKCILYSCRYKLFLLNSGKNRFSPPTKISRKFEKVGKCSKPQG